LAGDDTCTCYSRRIGPSFHLSGNRESAGVHRLPASTRDALRRCPAISCGGLCRKATGLDLCLPRVGTELLLRYGRWIRVTPQRIEQLRSRLSGFVVPTIILARFTPGLTVLTSFACGVSNMRTRQFLKAVASQLVVWEVAFLTAGALGGLAVRSIDPSAYPRAVILIIGISISLGAIGSYVLYQMTRRRTKMRGRLARTATTSHAR